VLRADEARDYAINYSFDVHTTIGCRERPVDSAAARRDPETPLSAKAAPASRSARRIPQCATIHCSVSAAFGAKRR
jgi:hypothetical protein